MQKNSIFLIAFFFVWITANAQFTPVKNELHPITDSVAGAMCNCIITNKDSITTLYKFYAALDACLKNCSASRIDALLKEDGFIQTDDRKARAISIHNIGTKLGKKVANECSGFKEILNTLIAKENKPELHFP